MPDAEVADQTTTLSWPRQRWWRVALVVAAIGVAAFSWEQPVVAFFGLLPTLVWCVLAKSPRTGMIVGLVLLVLLAWFVVPRALELTGPWVPASIEVYWFHTTLAAVVCAVGMLAGRQRPSELLPTMVVIGFVAAGGILFLHKDAPPGDEGVAPGPSRLTVARTVACGSGGCWGVLEATGDRATEVMRGYLVPHGYTPASEIDGVPRLCRRTGVLVTHEVCAELRTLSATAVRVEWYVN
ncbi:hypothetical protein OHS18_38090 [Amycolatopsis sp. NBC_00355]|uniref:hypothetical protein n=1 Tax=Amycolatopsis sp. NBC_00355 TaxID=2975957 RepID=UPI002E25A95C